MKVLSFEQFWNKELETRLNILKYIDNGELIVGIIKDVAKLSWDQSRYTSDNADRG